ncbi:MAG: M48 family metallopeptidase [Prevotellaceae bacterium]|jgi:predicted metal-dependent hydrolase|nr:M48 family metallopeptidase [Prevotellaceae bacterium]
MINKTVHIQNSGIIEYKVSHKAKYLRIKVTENNGIEVTVPAKMPLDEAEIFVRSKEKWIIKSLQHLALKKKKYTVYEPHTEFKTKFRQMKLISEDRKNFRLKISGNCFEIFYPQNVDIMHETVQTSIRKLIEHVWKVEAYEYLPERVSLLASRCNLQFKNLTIKNTRSFWGKCCGDNSIVLSLHLMHLPDHLIDYVIIHELCHTIHKNHQKEFWKLFESLTGGKAKIMAKEMKNYSTRIY